MRHSSLIRYMLLALGAAASSITALAAEKADIRYDGIPAGAYAVLAEVRAKPGKEQELRQVTLPLVDKVRAEPHNIIYFLHEDRASPGHFIFYEIFATKADFDAHNDTPHVQAWFARLPELAEGNVKVTHMQLRGNTP